MMDWEQKGPNKPLWQTAVALSSVTLSTRPRFAFTDTSTDNVKMKIASFNVKNLGIKKVTNKTVVCHLTKIMSQYSVVMILEVVDKSGKAMEKLLKELNNAGSGSYSMTASCQLGRDTYKEKFVCFYRTDEATLTDCYQYEDNQAGDEDAFAREPFVLRFSCPNTVVKDLILIPVHTKPEDSLKELDELHDVVEAVRRSWGSDNIMILGDFNADGRYLSKKKKEKIRICSEPYRWLIGDDVDTTSSNHNDNTYDRIVVYGENMLKAVVPGSAKSFNYQKEFNLTDEEALSISDHYPVEVELKTEQNHEDAPPTRKRATTKGKTPKTGPQRKTEPAQVKKRTAPKKKSGDTTDAVKTPTKRRRLNK